jgi:hypothetical protein
MSTIVSSGDCGRKPGTMNSSTPAARSGPVCRGVTPRCPPQSTREDLLWQPRSPQYDSVSRMLVFLPPATDAKYDSSSAHVICRHRGVGEHRRVPVGVPHTGVPSRTRGTTAARPTKLAQLSRTGHDISPSADIKWSGSHTPSQPLRSVCQAMRSMSVHAFYGVRQMLNFIRVISLLGGGIPIRSPQTLKI